MANSELNWPGRIEKSRKTTAVATLVKILCRCPGRAAYLYVDLWPADCGGSSSTLLNAPVKCRNRYLESCRAQNPGKAVSSVIRSVYIESIWHLHSTVLLRDATWRLSVIAIHAGAEKWWMRSWQPNETSDPGKGPSLLHSPRQEAEPTSFCPPQSPSFPSFYFKLQRKCIQNMYFKLYYKETETCSTDRPIRAYMSARDVFQRTDK